MKKQKTPLSLIAQSFWGQIVIGMLWIGVGITGLFDTVPMLIVEIILLSIGVIILGVILKARREDEDEMSDYNFMKSKALAHDIMHYVFCFASIIAAVVFTLLQKNSAYVNWPRVITGLIFFLMGLQYLITGIAFCRLEAE